MAYTKVFAIRARLDDRVKYAVNGEKTELDERIVYTADPEKTDTVRFVTTLNCRSAETAFAAMQKTKKKYKKTGGVLGYHFIQSFAPGEVTPEQAHEIGCEFARRLFGEDFEVVIGTHLDKAHPHNHIIVNSVSRTDGHKYHSSPESYYNDVRGTSDALCRENDLSVITPQGMKKIVSLALALVLVLSLTACGGKDGGKSADPNLGKYIGTEFSSDGDSWYSLADLYDGECYIELKSDGKGVFCLGGEATDIKWSLESDGALTLKRDGLESNGLLQDSCIMLDDLWGNEVYTLYEKEDADSSPEKTGDTLLDWWNGDWYGWWKMTGCSGYYEDMEGDWWDICGNIDIGADKTGVVRLWDEDYSRDSLMAKVNVTLSTAGTGEHGTMTSEDGQFTDIAIEHADWIVDPGLADRDDLICIDGWYENGEDEFYYEIYLRPWGTYWDDADEDSRPKSYDDWYLPLIKAGKSMPDAIGADAPASSGDTKSTAPSGNSNAPSGTGLVSEEAVQKGYVWMNEVNNNIFDSTYEDLVDYFGVEGEFVKEEYSDHMKRNQRYYKWVSKDDSSHYVYVNFAEEEPGVYKVSAFNTSGFSGKEAIEKYLDTVKAEAAEVNKASTANTKMKDFSVTVAQFAHDDVAVKITTKIPESGWSYDEGKKCLVENDDPTAFGAGAIRFEVRANVEDFDYYKDSFENYQDIDDRVIGGITFKGRTYKRIGYDWIEYVAQIDDGRALSIGLTDIDCVPGTMPDVILSGMTIK